MTHNFLLWDTGADGRPEAYAACDCWAIYYPPPGQSSGPRTMQRIRKGGFIGTQSAMADIGVFATEAEAFRVCYR